MVPLVFCFIIIKDSLLLSLTPQSVDSLPINFNIVDFTKEEELFLLTKYEIIKVDSNLNIGKILPLPRRYFQVYISDKLFLLGLNEILVLGPDSLEVVDALALPEGDYKLMGKEGDRLFLFNRTIEGGVVEIYSLSQGRRIRALRFREIDDVRLSKSGILIFKNNQILLYSHRLKKIKKLATIDSLTDVHDFSNRIALIKGDSIKIITAAGDIILSHYLPGFEFRAGEDILLAYQDTQMVVYPYPNFNPASFKVTEHIEDVYINDLVYIKGEEYLWLNYQNGSIGRIKPKVVASIPSDSGYYLQVGAFNNADNALNLLNDLLAKGYPAHNITGKIRIGPFASWLDGIEFGRIAGVKDYWMVKDIKRELVGIEIGNGKYLPIIVPEMLLIYDTSDSVLKAKSKLSGKFTHYFSHDLDLDGSKDLVVIGKEGHKIIKEEEGNLKVVERRKDEKSH